MADCTTFSALASSHPEPIATPGLCSRKHTGAKAYYTLAMSLQGGRETQASTRGPHTPTAPVISSTSAISAKTGAP